MQDLQHETSERGRIAVQHDGEAHLVLLFNRDSYFWVSSRASHSCSFILLHLALLSLISNGQMLYHGESRFSRHPKLLSWWSSCMGDEKAEFRSRNTCFGSFLKLKALKPSVLTGRQQGRPLWLISTLNKSVTAQHVSLMIADLKKKQSVTNRLFWNKNEMLSFAFNCKLLASTGPGSAHSNLNEIRRSRRSFEYYGNRMYFNIYPISQILSHGSSFKQTHLIVVQLCL